MDTPGGDNELFLYDFDTEIEEQFTFKPGAVDRWPLWSPDGSQVVFSSTRDGGRLYAKPADGTGAAEPITANTGILAPETWADDGETLMVGGTDFMAVRVGADAVPETLLETDENESIFSLSPNGRWMTYVSNVSGEQRIYVRPFPDLSSGGQRLVSDGPGDDPLWGPDGREPFYLTPDAAMVVPVETGDAFQRGAPKQLFSMDPYFEGLNFSWDISPDSQRFVMVKRGEESEAQTQIIVVQNWFEELKRLVPTP